MLRAPLPTTLNYNLAIHSNDPFWIVQKDQASLSAVRLTTPRRPVQTGRLRGCFRSRHRALKNGAGRVQDKATRGSPVRRPWSTRGYCGGSVRCRQPSPAWSDYRRTRRGCRISRAAPRVRRGYDGLAPEAARERGRLFVAGVGSRTVLFATSAVFDAERDLRLRVGVALGS